MIYVLQSTDVGAPILTGESGSLINLLDKCLVDGYGTVSIASMTRAGSVVTVNTTAAHNLQDYAAVQIGGADQAEYNGKWRVATVPGPSSFTFNIGMATPASPATGTMTVKRAPVGFPKPFAASNKGSYRQPAGSNQHYIDVDDNAVDSQRSASFRGYRAMTAVGVGTEPFPTVAQRATSLVRKNNVTGSTPRPWALIADDAFFYLLVAFNSGSPDYEINAFGECGRLNALDMHATICEGCSANAANSGSTPLAARYTPAGTSVYLAGDLAGSPGAVPHFFDGMFTRTFNSIPFNNAPVPGAVTGDNIATPIYLMDTSAEATRQLRAKMPGMKHGLYDLPSLTQGSIRSDFVEEPGRRYMAFRCMTGSTGATSRGICYFDIDGPWR